LRPEFMIDKMTPRATDDIEKLLHGTLSTPAVKAFFNKDITKKR